MNRRSFIRKMIGAGAALYVPEKTYGFLFADKCEAWRKIEYVAFKATFDGRTGWWEVAPENIPKLSRMTMTWIEEVNH